MTPPAAAAMSEAELQAAVIECARALGWRVAHFRAARRQSGAWSTPVAADGAGFPDLCMARQRDGRLLFAELKAEVGRVAPEQKEWLTALETAWPEVYVWRPAAWRDGSIESVLR